MNNTSAAETSTHAVFPLSISMGRQPAGVRFREGVPFVSAQLTLPAACVGQRRAGDPGEREAEEDQGKGRDREGREAARGGERRGSRPRRGRRRAAAGAARRRAPGGGRGGGCERGRGGGGRAGG